MLPPADNLLSPDGKRAAERSGNHARLHVRVIGNASRDLPLQRSGVTRGLLPCLVAAERRLRFWTAVDDGLLTQLLDQLADAAELGLSRLVALERDRLSAARAVAQSFRPGTLLPLLARPVASPRAIEVVRKTWTLG